MGAMLKEQYRCSVDVLVLAERYAATKGKKLSFNEETCALAATLLIQKNQEARF